MHVVFNEIHTGYSQHFSYIAAFLFWPSICTVRNCHYAFPPCNNWKTVLCIPWSESTLFYIKSCHALLQGKYSRKRSVCSTEEMWCMSCWHNLRGLPLLWWVSFNKWASARDIELLVHQVFVVLKKYWEKAQNISKKMYMSFWFFSNKTIIISFFYSKSCLKRPRKK